MQGCFEKMANWARFTGQAAFVSGKLIQFSSAFIAYLENSVEKSDFGHNWFFILISNSQNIISRFFFLYRALSLHLQTELFPSSSPSLPGLSQYSRAAIAILTANIISFPSSQVVIFHLPNKEVPVEERNGHTHEEEEQAEEEEGEAGEEEVAQGETEAEEREGDTVEDEAPAEEEEEEETEEVTEDTVIAPYLESSS